jgi:hypothetical protein
MSKQFQAFVAIALLIIIVLLAILVLSGDDDNDSNLPIVTATEETSPFFGP